jgi:hypothetical protein
MCCDACDVGRQTRRQIVVWEGNKDDRRASQKCGRTIEHGLKRRVSVDDYDIKFEANILRLQRADSAPGILNETPAVQIFLEYLNVKLRAGEVLLYLARHQKLIGQETRSFMKDQDVLPSCSKSGGNEKKREYEGSGVSPHDDSSPAHQCVWHLTSKLCGDDEARFLDRTRQDLRERFVRSYQVETVTSK